MSGLDSGGFQSINHSLDSGEAESLFLGGLSLSSWAIPALAYGGFLLLQIFTFGETLMSHLCLDSLMYLGSAPLLRLCQSLRDPTSVFPSVQSLFFEAAPLCSSFSV